MQILSSEGSAPAETAIAPPRSTFPIGETLTYQISWWGVPVGTITFSAAASSAPATKGLVKLHSEALSNAYLNAFYPVRVEMTSFVDPATRRPRHFEAFVKRRQRIHQGTVVFDPDQNMAHHTLPKGRSADVPVMAATQDGLSIVYYARMIDLAVGQKIPLTITADGKNWNLNAQVLRTSTVQVAHFGRFQAVEVTTQLSYPVPFFQGAKAWIWMSADADRIPLLIRIHSLIGPVSVVLTKRSKI